MSEVKAKVAKKPAAKKEAAKGQVRLVQTGSPIGREASQRATLVGLKLNKLRRESLLEDTPAVRGMIRKVRHLVQEVK